MTGPEVCVISTPSSCARIPASVVLPRPGGPVEQHVVERLAARPRGGRGRCPAPRAPSAGRRTRRARAAAGSSPRRTSSACSSGSPGGRVRRLPEGLRVRSCAGSHSPLPGRRRPASRAAAPARGAPGPRRRPAGPCSIAAPHVLDRARRAYAEHDQRRDGVLEQAAGQRAPRPRARRRAALRRLAARARPRRPRRRRPRGPGRRDQRRRILSRSSMTMRSAVFRPTPAMRVSAPRFSSRIARASDAGREPRQHRERHLRPHARHRRSAARTAAARRRSRSRTAAARPRARAGA